MTTNHTMETLRRLRQRAEEIFLHPSPQYPWEDVIQGARVCKADGTVDVIPAVGQNTFRGFHRIDKGRRGPAKAFKEYFVSQKRRLAKALLDVESERDFEQLTDEIHQELIEELDNIRPDQLACFNKVRKPIDLYLEHLVAMAQELEPTRPRLVPLLRLPLDSWVMQTPAIFTGEQLRRAGLARGATYGDVREPWQYHTLQEFARENAARLSRALGAPFHPIYFDLFWHDRYQHPGGNLIATNS
ncbi:MAG: hypothetical protein D6766_12010 [Verrucomicrobia bacterium]|nr:MAG: hypothetical protein D6766_12010 [Verrucomicrobiota bacterium]